MESAETRTRVKILNPKQNAPVSRGQRQNADNLLYFIGSYPFISICKNATPEVSTYAT